MFNKKQRLFLTFIPLLLLLFICFFSVSALDLEVKYPSMGGQVPTKETTFPDYVKYLFNFSIVVAGIIAFGVLVFAGFNILTSPDQPETVKDARTKIIGAFLGIVILLSSYLILTTINPQLSMLSLEAVTPYSGIYLINSKGERDYIPDSTPKITFESIRMEFLSTKDELTTVYLYSGEDYGGTEDIIDNHKSFQKEVSQSSVASPKSIYFLWNKAGAYLYPETNYGGRPLFTSSGISNLSSYDFDKKAKSLKFKPASGYGAAFFTQSNFSGSCGFVVSKEEIPNLESGDDGNYKSIGAPSFLEEGGLSSFYLFDYGKKQPAGSVIFFDTPNCSPTGHSKIEPNITGNPIRQAKLSNARFDENNNDGGREIKLQDHIISFQINGNFGVILTTKEDFNGRCKLFFPPGGDNCYPSIESSYLWDYTWLLGPSVGSYAIIPLTQ